jgi:hypothetical protein
MNTFGNIKTHTEKHAYKRGAHKGDAPLDSSKRGRNHTRTRVADGVAYVRMHRTDILTAYPDGRIVIDCEGWSDFSTTKMRLAEAFKFVPFRIGVFGRTVMGLSRLCVAVGYDRKTYLYYDGIEFDGEGKLLSEPKPFLMKRINREEPKELATDLTESGFKAGFPFLYATATPHESIFKLPVQWRDYIRTVDHAHRWSEIIASFKFTAYYDYKTSKRITAEAGDKKTCWAAIMSASKSNMYETLTSNVASV